MVPARPRREGVPKVIPSRASGPGHATWPATLVTGHVEARAAEPGTGSAAGSEAQPPLSPVPLHETFGFQSLNVPNGLLL